MNNFEKNVRKALIDRGFSMKDLAENIGISQAYIYDIFKGNRPGGKQKLKIVEFLNLDPAILSSVEESESICAGISQKVSSENNKEKQTCL